MLANFAVAAFHHVPRLAAWIVQEGGAVGWDPISLWKQMGIIAKIVVIILFIMSSARQRNLGAVSADWAETAIQWLQQQRTGDHMSQSE